MVDTSIKIENYKCFTDASGFDRLKRVNLIVGRNNVGKSSLLDLIEAVVSNDYGFGQQTWRRNAAPPAVVLESEIDQDIAEKIFPGNMSAGAIPGNHRDYGLSLVGRWIKWSKTQNGASLIDCQDEGLSVRLADTGGYAQSLVDHLVVPLKGKTFKKIAAERDIVPEAEDATIVVHPNGEGVTNTVQSFVNKVDKPSELVERDVLAALNEVFAQDARFTRIVVQKDDRGLWEIYLEEEHKGRIALSKSGSGLKTVLAVLANLILIPVMDNKPLNEFVFGFEELENNIHPALLRRLNNYVYESSKENDFTYFLTTHSNVMIDQFSKQSDAQIVHVAESESSTVCTTVKTYLEHDGILDDLDVRASDILQANGIIWVEGPSDRTYLNRWIDLWSEGSLREGSHYQIVFYGGRLLSHLDANDPEIVEDSLAILRVNRHAAIMIDSDKADELAEINETKSRIASEFGDYGYFCWITSGREIENYIPSDAFSNLLNIENYPGTPQYDSVFDLMNSVCDGEGTKYRRKKTLLADKIASRLTKDNMSGVLDVQDRMDALCACILSWNS